MQAGLTTRSLESAVARNDYLGRDFVKKKSVNPLRLSLTRETDTQKKLVNFEKLQFLNGKIDQKTNFDKLP